MSSSQPSKPRLIVLEGPAGAGKTTLQQQLWREFVAKGITAKCIPEFSESVLGKSLRDHAQYGDSKPEWTVGLGGTLTFLADKIKLLEDAMRTPEAIWICDRLITSQLVLGLREITTEREKELTKKIIQALSGWIEERFAKDSIVFLLEAPLEVLKDRLEKRVGRTATRDELRVLVEEIDSYSSLEPLPTSWALVRLNSNDSRESFFTEAVVNIRSLWT